MYIDVSLDIQVAQEKRRVCSNAGKWRKRRVCRNPAENGDNCAFAETRKTENDEIVETRKNWKKGEFVETLVMEKTASL